MNEELGAHPDRYAMRVNRSCDPSIDVEVDTSIGLSVFNIVGLPDSSIRESRDRVMVAINNSSKSRTSTNCSSASH